MRMIVLGHDGTKGYCRAKTAIISVRGISPCVLSSSWKDPIKIVVEDGHKDQGGQRIRIHDGIPL